MRSEVGLYLERSADRVYVGRAGEETMARLVHGQSLLRVDLFEWLHGSRGEGARVEGMCAFIEKYPGYDRVAIISSSSNQ